MEKELLAKIAALAGFINKQKIIEAKSIPPSHTLSRRRRDNGKYWKTPAPKYYNKQSYGSDFVKKGKNKLIRRQPTDYVKRGKNKLVRTEIIKAHLFAPKKNISKISTRKFVNLRHKQNKYVPKRLTINGITFEKSTNGKSLVRSKTERTKQIASQKVKESIKTLQGKKKTVQYCIFYTKFGKCKNIEKCKYVHDPNKKAICRKFLKGECHNNECLLLHKIDSEKMPVCSYFLRGVCTNDNCPYSHVNVNPKAAVCEDFKKGYCPLGDKCKFKHTLKRAITTTNSAVPTSIPPSDNVSYNTLSIRPVFSSSVNKS